MDVRDVGVALWRQRALVLAVLLLAALGAGAVLLLADTTYEATARVDAVKQPTAALSPAELDQARAALARLGESPSVLAGVRRELGGDVTLPGLREAVEVTSRPHRAALEITVRDDDRARAARTADLVATALAGRAPADGSVVVTVTDRATVPRVPAEPSLPLLVGGGLAAGVVLAVLLALLRDRRTETVESATDVEAATVAPLLAHITAPADLTSMPAMRPGTAEAEVFRHLRTALEAEATAGPSKKVVVAGVSAGEVDVWLGANAAIALANVGRRVLLVDGRIGDRFGRPSEPGPDTPGLYDVLHGADLDRAVSPGPVEKLSVLPAGTWGDDLPGALLEHAFDGVMAEAAARFDVVVVLAPPLDQADDARQMAVAGSLLLAVPERGVSSTSLRSHVTRVRTAGGRILGVVLIGRDAESTAA